jgi:gas vesicle protein
MTEAFLTGVLTGIIVGWVTGLAWALYITRKP